MSLVQGGARSARNMIRQVRKQFFRHYEFENGAINSIISIAFNGGSAAFNAPTDNLRFGQCRIGRGTATATELGGIGSRNSGAIDNDGILFGGGLIVLEVDFKLNALPTAGNDYNCRIGFMDTTTPTTWTRTATSDAAFLEIDQTGGTSRYRFSRWTNGAETVSAALAATPDTAKHILTLVVNPAGTSIEVFIDDVSQGSFTTGLPSGITRAFNYGAIVEGIAGLLNRTCDMDRYVVAQDFTTDR